MADYRQIHTKMWKQDSWFLDLEPAQKLLFIYLFSNELASIAGIYELPLPVIAFETGLDRDFIRRALDEFKKAGKVYYESGIVWVVNLRKYNENPSPKVKTRIEKDVETIPDCEIKRRYMAYHYPNSAAEYPIDTLSIPIPELESEQEQEQEQEMEQEQDPPPAPDARANFVKEFEAATQRPITGTDAQQLSALVSECEFYRQTLAPEMAGADVHGEQWVMEAIREMARASPSNPCYRYVETIATRWQREGYKFGNERDENGRNPARTRGPDAPQGATRAGGGQPRDGPAAGSGPSPPRGQLPEYKRKALERLRRGGGPGSASAADV